MGDLDVQPEVRVERTEADRAQARKRIEKRRGLEGGFIAYVVVNALLVGIWAVSGGGYFWPGWVLAGWGIGMIFGVWDYMRGPITEADVDVELRRMRR
ncbi:MAG TPA: 2TM domain-containing protein [Acidimicrobiales bacterium]